MRNLEAVKEAKKRYMERSNLKVSICIPVIRLDGLKRCLKAIEKNAGIPKDQYEVIWEEDKNRIGCPLMLKQLVVKSRAQSILFLGDDTEPQEGFLKAAIDEMEKLPDGWGVVGLNTEGPAFIPGSPGNSNPLAHWMAHKKMLEYIPGGDFFSTDYKHCWCDNELRDIALDLDRWAFADDAIIEHNHPIVKKGEWDGGYKKAYSEKAQKHDKKTYWKRKIARNRKKHGIRLAIAEPLTDTMVYSHFHFSSIRVITKYLIHLFESGKSIAIDYLTPKYPGQIDVIRNGLVEQALFFGCTHILFMDTDQIYSDFNMIEKLLAHNKPVVGAKVHRRYPPFDPLLLRGSPGTLHSVPDEEIEEGGLVEVGATGCGCILYDMNIFTEIDSPWFELTVGEHGQPIGEDVHFCEKLKEAGHKIYVDCSIDIKHLSLLAVDWGTYKLYKKLGEVR